MRVSELNADIYPETSMAATLDRLKKKMQEMNVVDLPLVHRFTPGMYIREIFMPKGTIAITKIHKTEHPYAILKGAANVWLDGSVEKIKAPHVGITYPGTRRLIFVTEDCIWVTFHATNETDLEKIEEQLILNREIPYHNPEATELLPDIINELQSV